MLKKKLIQKVFLGKKRLKKKKKKGYGLAWRLNGKERKKIQSVVNKQINKKINDLPGILHFKVI